MSSEHETKPDTTYADVVAKGAEIESNGVSTGQFSAPEKGSAEQ